MLFFSVFAASLAFPAFSQAQDLHALLARQAPGSPAYECHAACGGVISAGRKPTAEYCTDAKFTANLDSCLKCANTYDVWGDYGNSVTKAASACSLSASPSPSIAGAGATSSPAATTAATASHDHGSNSTAAGGLITSTAAGAASSINAAATSATGSAAGAATSTVAGGGGNSIRGVNGVLASLAMILLAVV